MSDSSINDASSYEMTYYTIASYVCCLRLISFPYRYSFALVSIHITKLCMDLLSTRQLEVLMYRLGSDPKLFHEVYGKILNLFCATYI